MTLQENMNYAVTKKIKVVGCLNCPYHTATEKVINDETKEVGLADVCSHPSFGCIIPIDEDCINRLRNGFPQRMTSSYFPDWCPLETEVVVCCCNPVN